MQPSTPLDEERIADLLGKLPPPPDAWVERAARIPRVERDLSDVQRRLAEDALLRAAFREQGERALREAGLSFDADVLDQLREAEHG